MSELPDVPLTPMWFPDASHELTCFACRVEIEIGDPVFLKNVDGQVICWHQKCADQEDLARAIEEGK